MRYNPTDPAWDYPEHLSTPLHLMLDNDKVRDLGLFVTDTINRYPHKWEHRVDLSQCPLEYISLCELAGYAQVGESSVYAQTFTNDEVYNEG